MSQGSLLSFAEERRSPIVTVRLPPPTGQRVRRAVLTPFSIEMSAALGDLVLILGSSLASAILYKYMVVGISIRALGILGLSAVLSVNFVMLNAAAQNYRLKKLQLLSFQMRRVTYVWLLLCGLLVGAGFAMKVSNDYSRGASLLFFAMSLSALLLWRVLLARLIPRAIASQAFAKTKIILIAEKHLALRSTALNELRQHGYEPVAICWLTEVEMFSSGASSSLRKKLTDLTDVARTESVEGFYVLIGWNCHRAIDLVLDALQKLALPVHLLPDEGAARFLRCPTVDIGNTWTVAIKRPPLSRSELFLKRVTDIIGALAGLIIVAPLLLMTAVLIKLGSSGPILFRQRRNGFNGRTFNIFKFRTMTVMEDGPDIRQATAQDHRVTPQGRWLRRTSVDELPQLLNVLKGEMSLVGPRPHACSHDSEYEKSIASYAFRQHVKPGITGWAQVNGYRGETQQIDQMRRRIEHDLWYINNWSLKLDIWIMLRTVIVTLFQRSAY